MMILYMKESKVMTQEIQKISILYPKTSKEFYHHINEQVFFKKTVLKNFTIFTPVLSLFFNKNARLHPCNYIIKRLQHRWFFLTKLQNF